MKHKEVAKWLYDKILSEKYVSQDTAVYEIIEKFGDEYSYTNENGNPAIDREVLKEFRKLKKGNIIWERGDRTWHVRTELDDQLEDIEKNLPKIELPEFKFPEIE